MNSQVQGQGQDQSQKVKSQSICLFKSTSQMGSWLLENTTDLDRVSLFDVSVYSMSVSDRSFSVIRVSDGSSGLAM